MVRPPNTPARELTYEPDTGRYEATIDLDRVADVLGARTVTNGFGRALVVDRRYESDRFHGSRRVGDCAVADGEALRLLDPALEPLAALAAPMGTESTEYTKHSTERTLFVDLETTGLSGGAGTVAFLVGCGWFDMGAFQVRQFLLTSYASERALLAAVAECFADATLLVTYNGKTFDVPVMETRWLFHRIPPPLDCVRHFDMLHPARRLWKARESNLDEGGCRLGTLERILCGVTRVGDVPGMEIPTRYFRFLRSGDAAPLEPVLEHNRLDLISLAAVTAHAVELVEQGSTRCRDAAEALALGKVFDRAGCDHRATRCYERAADDPAAHVDVVAESLYRLGIRLRRDRRYEEAAAIWRRILELRQGRYGARSTLMPSLRQFATEALAIHHEHREKDYEGAREFTLRLLEDTPDAERPRHRLDRLDRKIARKNDSHLFA